MPEFGPGERGGPSGVVDRAAWCRAVKSRGILEESQLDIGHIPAILFVEDAYDLHSDLKEFRNVVSFNRRSPEEAIEKIKLRINSPAQTKSDFEEFAPYLLGGVALVALVALLSKGEPQPS